MNADALDSLKFGRRLMLTKIWLQREEVAFWRAFFRKAFYSNSFAIFAERPR